VESQRRHPVSTGAVRHGPLPRLCFRRNARCRNQAQPEPAADHSSASSISARRPSLPLLGVERLGGVHRHSCRLAGL
jgi:hypothetical protein